MEVAQPRRSKLEIILDAAMQEFLANGYVATSLDHVAKVAGVSKATVYSYFQYKELLFKALIERLATEEFCSTFGTEEEQILEGDPAQALPSFAHRMLNNCQNNLQFMRFMRVLLSESERFPELAKTFTESLEKPTLQRLTLYFSGCQNLKLDNPDIAAQIFLGTLISYVIRQELLYGKEIAPVNQADFVDGLVGILVERIS